MLPLDNPSLFPIINTYQPPRSIPLWPFVVAVAAVTLAFVALPVVVASAAAQLVLSVLVIGWGSHAVS